MDVYLRNLYYGLLLIVLCWLGGCATVPPQSSQAPIKSVPTAPTVQGIYHKVHAGETIWRIAKTYGVTIDDIIRNNKSLSVNHIEKEQLIFIPGAEHMKSVILDQGPKDSEFVWPIKGKVLCYFGEHKGNRVNKGIDIQASEGEVLRASRSGKVIFADYLHGYDYTLILDHSDGYYSVYTQNSKLMVKLDDFIAQGSPIAQVGKDGQIAFLHFEIRKKATAYNPLYYLP